MLEPDVYDPTLNPLYKDFLAHYGVVALPARVGDPDRKGKVERSIGYAQGTPLKWWARTIPGTDWRRTPIGNDAPRAPFLASERRESWLPYPSRRSVGRHPLRAWRHADICIIT